MGRPAKAKTADVVEQYQELKATTRRGAGVVNQLAEKFGVNRLTIYNHLRKGGIHRPHSKKDNGEGF